MWSGMGSGGDGAAANDGTESNKLPPPLLRAARAARAERLFFTESPANSDDIFKRESPNTEEENSSSVGRSENKGRNITGENKETPPQSPVFCVAEATNILAGSMWGKKVFVRRLHMSRWTGVRPMFLSELFGNFGHRVPDPTEETKSFDAEQSWQKKE